jgi:GntR family transcriptional regulator / MocR family aminotransferase
MPKLATFLPLSLSAPPSGMPLYRWFYSELRAAILEGRIPPGARLPATRDLARDYKLSRATVVTAFDQLRSEGYVEGRVGAGTYVSQVLPDDLLQVARTSAARVAGPKRVRWSSYAKRLEDYRGGEPRITRAFRTNQAALDVFPTTLWAQVASRRLRRASTQLLAGGEALGYRPLRRR